MLYTFCRDDEVTTLPTRLCASSGTSASRTAEADPDPEAAVAVVYLKRDSPIVKAMITLRQ